MKLEQVYHHGIVYESKLLKIVSLNMHVMMTSFLSIYLVEATIEMRYDDLHRIIW
jgi:hypothetical protein